MFLVDPCAVSERKKNKWPPEAVCVSMNSQRAAEVRSIYTARKKAGNMRGEEDVFLGLQNKTLCEKLTACGLTQVTMTT